MDNGKYMGNVYFDGMVDINDADHFCDYLVDHIVDIIESYRRTYHEENED